MCVCVVQVLNRFLFDPTIGLDWACYVKKGNPYSTWSNTHPKINKSSFGNYFLAFSPRKT
jgi:hypothetical protein